MGLVVKRQPQPFSWMNPKLEVRNTATCGKGVFAKFEIAQAERVIILGGAVIPATAEQGDYGVQISEDLVLAAPTKMDICDADYVNHSCDPNVGFQGQIVLVALRQIMSGEEITFDYAMCLHPVPGLSRYEMKCSCGKSNCRTLITEDDWENPTLQRRYDGYFQWYLQVKVEQLRRKVAKP